MPRGPDRRGPAAGARRGGALLAAGGGQGRSSRVAVQGRRGGLAWVRRTASAARSRRPADDRRARESVARRSHGAGRRPGDRVGRCAAGRPQRSQARSRSPRGCRREGIRLVPDFVYTRTFNGFAAAIDARGARPPRARSRRGGRLSRAGRLSRVALAQLSSADAALRGGRARAASSRIARLRRRGRHHRAPRHGGRRDASLPPRTGSLDGLDVLDPDGRAHRAAASGRADARSNATARRSPA